MKTTPLTSPLLLILTATLCFFSGCERPERTVDELRQEITAFRAAPDDQKFVSIEKGLANLDASILKLRNAGKVEKATALQEQRDSLAADFGTAKVQRTLQDAKSALKGIQDVIQKTGDNLHENPSTEPMSAPSTSPHTENPASSTEASSSWGSPSSNNAGGSSAATPEVGLPESSSATTASPTPQASQIPASPTPVASPMQ